MPEIVDELFDNIVSEKDLTDSHDRYPVRFIFLPLSSALSPYVLSLSSRLSLTIKKLSDFFPNDKWVTWEYLYEKIESFIMNSDDDVLFFGLSEYLRLCKQSEVETAFLNLIGLENSFSNRRGKRRAYFLMDSFETVLKRIVQDNHHRNVFYNPSIDGEVSSVNVGLKKPQLIISELIETNTNLLQTVREYIDIPTRTDLFDFSKPLYCNSKTIRSLSSKNADYLGDSLFEYLCIDNPLTIIKMKLTSVDFALPEFSDNEFVNWLGEKITIDSKPQSFDDFVKSLTVINVHDPHQVVYEYSSCSDSNLKKVLRIIIKNSSSLNISWGFIGYLVDNYSISSVQDLIKNTYLSCSESVVVNSFYNERFSLLEFLVGVEREIDAPQALINVFDGELEKIIRANYILPSDFSVSLKNDLSKTLLDLSPSEEKLEQVFKTYKENFVLRVITNNSLVEKRIIILLVSKGILTSEDLERIYPDLYGYLFYSSNGLEKDAFLDSYFLDYKKSKLFGKATLGYLKALNEVSPDWFLNLYNSHTYKNIDNTIKAKHIFVLDGVGAEYMSLLTYLLETKNNINVSKASYRKALLPTITSINKELIDSLQPKPFWFQEFDSQIIHGDFYSVEKNLEKAISLLSDLVSKIVAEARGESFLIIADHGCTISHKILGASKTYNFVESEHDGRCCKIKSGQQYEESSDGDYLKYTDRSSNDWIIPIKHISLYKTAKYEAHGGGTMEEIFIPYIYVASLSGSENISISVIKKDVSGRDRTIKFTVYPEVDAEEITVIEQTGNVSHPILSEGVYIANLSVGKTQKVIIRINGHEEEVQVRSNSGINSGNGGFF